MASTYTQLKRGSTGNEVNALQTALNKKGYSLANTGIFDDATESAIRQYQQDYGLTVDGVADDTTLGSLYGTQQSGSGGYTPSKQLVEAQKYAESVQAQKPGAYESPFTQQLQQQFGAIMNRQPFSYDVGTDPMFQQASDRYVQMGRRAMQDAMGQAASMTGGYGNSYAQGAGQAAYGTYMQDLSELAPQYMNAAYTRYQGEGADMLDRYNVTAGREDEAYARYMDKVNQYNADVERAQQAANAMYEREYGQYMDQQSAANADREYAYNTALMMLQGGKMPSTMLLEAAGISAEDAKAIAAMYKSSKSSGGSKSSADKKTTQKVVVNNPEKSASNASEETGTTSDVVLSREAWEADRKAKDPFYAAQKETTKKILPAKSSIANASAGSTEEYNTYVENTITDALQKKKISKLDAVVLANKYLSD